MNDEEIGLTRLFNDHLAGLGNCHPRALSSYTRRTPTRPWANFIVMQIVVALIIVVVFGLLRSRLSVDKPGKLQQIMEELYGFLRGQSEENVGHHGRRYLSLFGTLFIFILFANLIGTIPGLAIAYAGPVRTCRMRADRVRVLQLDGHAREWRRQIPRALRGPEGVR